MDPLMPPHRTITCSSHGRAPWSGQVQCIGCGAVWHLTNRAEEPPTHDGTCTCGRALLVRGTLEGSARVVCPGCYAALRAQKSAGAS